MFMPFDRTPHTSRQSHYTPVPDATGTPFQQRHNSDGGRPHNADKNDFRDQADGAP